MSGRRPDEGARTVELVRAAGGDARFVRADVSRAGDVDRLVHSAVEAFGRIDVLVNNAGTEGVVAPITALCEADFDHAVAVNLMIANLDAEPKRVRIEILDQDGCMISRTEMMLASNQQTFRPIKSPSTAVAADDIA